MPSIFINPAVEKKFHENGWVVVPFSDAETLAAHYHSVSKLNPSDRYGGSQVVFGVPQTYHSTFLDSNITYKTDVLALLAPLFNRFTEQHLNNYELLQANVFNKPAGTGFVYPHQNLTVVDEHTFTSLSIWVPLQNVTKHNGALWLLSGSQKRFARFRNHQIPWPYYPLFKGEVLEAINLSVGEALVFDDSLVHGSGENQSNEPRFALHAVVKPIAALSYYYLLNTTTQQIEVYEVSDNSYWQTYIPGVTAPPDKLVICLPYNEKYLPESTIDTFLRMPRFDEAK